MVAKVPNKTIFCFRLPIIPLLQFDEDIASSIYAQTKHLLEYQAIAR